MPILGAYLMPHPPIMLEAVGGDDSQKTRATHNACVEIATEISRLNPDTVIVVTPHGTGYHDAITIFADDVLSGSLEDFGAPSVYVKAHTDHELIEAIISSSEKGSSIPVAAMTGDVLLKHNRSKNLDHGAIVPLSYLTGVLEQAKLLHITYTGFGMKEHYLFGKLLKETINKLKRKAIIIASGDMSHKLPPRMGDEFSPMGAVFDAEIKSKIETHDGKGIITMSPKLMEAAGVCAPNSIAVLLGTLDEVKWEGTVLSYESPFGVGYMTAVFRQMNESTVSVLHLVENEMIDRMKKLRAEEDEYVKLARLTLESYVNGEAADDAFEQTTPEMLTKQAGVFVSIKKNGALRGCIGTIMPTQESIAMEILENAVKAGAEDPRFPPVMVSELNELVYSVDVLMEPEPITSDSELDVKKYGVIVRYGQKQGLLLPNLEGIDTVEEQIATALRKAGISENSPYEMMRFEVIRHH